MKAYFSYLLCIILSAVLIAETANAQDKPQFPTTRKGIADELGKSPKNPLGQRGQSKSLNSKKSVPSEIVQDSPRVGALIQFDHNSDAIKPESYPLLKEFRLVFQKDLPDAIVMIEGHTDSTGSDDYNLLLSQRRADAVKKYLKSEFQLDENRLITKPYGKSSPIASNDNEDGRALNRRVEFVRVK